MDLRVLATFAAGVFRGVLFAGLDLEDILNASQPSIHRCFSPRYCREEQRDDGDGEANVVMGVDSGTADLSYPVHTPFCCRRTTRSRVSL